MKRPVLQDEMETIVRQKVMKNDKTNKKQNFMTQIDKKRDGRGAVDGGGFLV